MTKGYKAFLAAYKKRQYVILFIQIFLLLFFIGSWELFARIGWIDSFIFSSPTQILLMGERYLESGELWRHTLVSSYEVLLGLIIGTSCGILIAIILYEFQILAKILDPFLIVLNALPKTALAPIFIIWIGTSQKGIVFIAISISIILTIISAYRAFCSVEEEKIKLLRTFGANRLQILTNLILPANIDEMISITKINIGMSWIGVIVGEFIVSKEGLGYLITYGTQVFRLDLVMLGVVSLSIVTMLMYGLLNLGVKLYKKFRGW